MQLKFDHETVIRHLGSFRCYYFCICDKPYITSDTITMNKNVSLQNAQLISKNAPLSCCLEFKVFRCCTLSDLEWFSAPFCCINVIVHWKLIKRIPAAI